MNFRGAVTQKAWKQKRRERARADMTDLRERHVLVEGVQYGVEFSFDHGGTHIGSCETVALYFENGQRIAILRKSGNDELDALHGRLLSAFYHIEVRT